MPFELLSAPVVYITVRIPSVRAGEAGRAEQVLYDVEIQAEILKRDEVAKWVVETVEAEASPIAERPEKEFAAFKKVARDWRGLTVNEKPVDFTDEYVAQLVQTPGFMKAFTDAYIEVWHGRVEVREGNSASSPANGLAGEPTGETPKAATRRTPSPRRKRN